ncbi:MAG: HAMP domain-containing histidine kinase [Caulobacteraceae bacterium]|nr:HAMP domain-containing histidine kinase [Caulobacteraceae bacterium]
MAQPAYISGPDAARAPATEPLDAAADPSRRSLVRMVSHELRTPLNAIIGFSEIIANEMYGPLKGEYREAADVIRVSGHKLLRLVNQVLEVAKLQGGAADLDLRPEPLDAILDDAAAGLGEEAVGRNLRVDVRLPTPVPLVLADARAVRTALANLVQNAVAFSPDGGEIRLTGKAHGALVLIEVADDGPGLDPSELPRLMEPFQQGENALTRRHQGAGLGWAIVRLLCQAMGGGFNIAAEPGRGLTATIALRRAG